MKRIKHLLPLIVIALLLAATLGNYSGASASPAGSPARAGGSASVEISGVTTPCSTLKQCAGMLVPGAIMHVSGEWNESVEILASGTAANPITIAGSGALINTSDHSGIIIRGQYVNVSGFEVTGTDSYGIYVSGQNDIVENNVLHHNVVSNGTGGNCGGTSWESALKVAVGAENVIVRGNSIYENCGEGIAVTRGVNTLIENNTVWDNFSMNIYTDNSPYVLIRNNTSTCTGIYLKNGERPMGIGLGEESYSGWGSQRHDIVVANNSVSGCGVGIGLLSSNVGGTLLNVTVSGNTVIDGTIRSISVLSKKNVNVLIENNQIYNEIYVPYPDGVTLLNNTIIGSTPSIFTDVPSTYWAVTYIEALYNAGITSGCSTSPLMYCPAASVTRAQMAVFLLRGIHGSSYAPPPATGAVFGDVSTSTFAAAWIEQLAAEGITSGCGSGNYCPDATVTRAQMAIFLLRSKYGSSYVPPVATGIFSDVPVGSFAADWIEQLAAEGITSGCGGGKYCPNSAVTRDQMAVFLVKTFNLL